MMTKSGHMLIEALHKVIAANPDYYHGTKSDFKTFTKIGTGKHGLGFYFTPDYNEAIYFSKTLAGDQAKSQPKIFTVKLKFKKPFNTMSIPDATEVAAYYDIPYKPPKRVGGAVEHYHILGKRLKGAGVIKNEKKDLNDAIQKAGFDAIEFDLMGHIVVFDPKQITIKKVTSI